MTKKDTSEQITARIEKALDEGDLDLAADLLEQQGNRLKMFGNDPSEQEVEEND